MNIKLLMVACSAALLAACGGGDDETTSNGADPSVDVAAKYAGTWSLCYSAPQSSVSTKVDFILERVDNLSLNYSWVETNFTASTNCTGASTPDYNESGTMVFAGTKTASGRTVDRADVTITESSDETINTPSTKKDIGYVDGSTLLLGDENSTPDASGYPSALYLDAAFTKQ